PRDEQESPAHPRRMNELERRAVVASVESTGQETAGAGAGMQRQIGPGLGTAAFTVSQRPRDLRKRSDRSAWARRRSGVSQYRDSIPTDFAPCRTMARSTAGTEAATIPNLSSVSFIDPILCRIAGRGSAA